MFRKIRSIAFQRCQMSEYLYQVFDNGWWFNFTMSSHFTALILFTHLSKSASSLQYMSNNSHRQRQSVLGAAHQIPGSSIGAHCTISRKSSPFLWHSPCARTSCEIFSEEPGKYQKTWCEPWWGQMYWHRLQWVLCMWRLFNSFVAFEDMGYVFVGSILVPVPNAVLHWTDDYSDDDGSTMMMMIFDLWSWIQWWWKW